MANSGQIPHTTLKVKKNPSGVDFRQRTSFQSVKQTQRTLQALTRHRLNTSDNRSRFYRSCSSTPPPSWALGNALTFVLLALLSLIIAPETSGYNISSLDGEQNFDFQCFHMRDSLNCACPSVRALSDPVKRSVALTKSQPSLRPLQGLLSHRTVFDACCVARSCSSEDLLTICLQYHGSGPCHHFSRS